MPHKKKERQRIHSQGGRLPPWLLPFFTFLVVSFVSAFLAACTAALVGCTFVGTALSGFALLGCAVGAFAVGD